MSAGQWRASARSTNPVQVLDATALASLAAGSAVLSAAQSNDGGTELDQVVAVRLTIGSFGSAPALNAPVELYVCYSLDNGATFADGGSSVLAGGQLVAVFPVRAVATAQNLLLPQPLILLPLDHKWLLRNATAQAFGASGSSLDVWYGGF